MVRGGYYIDIENRSYSCNLNYKFGRTTESLSGYSRVPPSTFGGCRYIRTCRSIGNSVCTFLAYGSSRSRTKQIGRRCSVSGYKYDKS